jgi:hypothetical protein
MPGLKHHIIGLCGFASSGKDTVADLLITHAGFRKIAFADALKAELAEAFHVEPIVFSRPEYKARPMEELALTRCTERGYIDAALRHAATVRPGCEVNAELVRPRTPRETMQLWGTEYRRSYDANYWTGIVCKRINYYMTAMHERHFVITDCRFENEVAALRSMGGWLWQVKRPGIDSTSTNEGRHASATDGTQFEPDAVIGNTHDMKHLQQQALAEFWALDAGLVKINVEIVA